MIWIPKMLNHVKYQLTLHFLKIITEQCGQLDNCHHLNLLLIIQEKYKLSYKNMCLVQILHTKFERQIMM
jgi:hypothetical protein